jgi:hypothetical protein
VWIQRLSADPTATMDLFQCEVPPPYSGDLVGSVAQVRVQTVGGVTSATVQFTSDSTWYGLLKPGDFVRFNYRGSLYQLNGKSEQDPAGSGTFVDATQEDPVGSGNIVLKEQNTLRFQIVLVNAADPTFHFPAVAAAAGGNWATPYQVIRQPVKTAAPPTQLPAGAVVDLEMSGQNVLSGHMYELISGLTQAAFRDATTTADGNANKSLPIIVTFDRTGALEFLYLRGKASGAGPGPSTVQLQQIQLLDAIHFLVGKREKLASIVPAAEQPAGLNWQDQENLWVSINPQTGVVTSAEVANELSGSPAADLKTSRRYATAAQNTGGR